MRALLGHELPQLDSSAVDRPPQAPAVASMEKTIAFLSKSWILHDIVQSNLSIVTIKSLRVASIRTSTSSEL